jgi:ABC-type sugar transport system substrate-binding protein/acetyl esterase/lipase
MIRSLLAVVLLGAWTIPSQAQTSDKPRFLLLTPFVDYAFFAPMKRGAADAAQALGVELIFTGTTDGNASALAEQAEAALDAGYQGIGINMIDAQAFDAVAEEAARKGVPLISFNVDDAKTPNARLATVGQNMLDAGRQFGQAMAPLIPPGARVLLTMHDPGITALEERAAGAREALQAHQLQWMTLITGTDREAAVAEVRAALEADPSIRVVLGTGEADTQAAGLAIERHFKGKGYVAAGFDTGGEILRLVKAGILQLTVDQQPYAQGYFAVASLALAHRSGLRPVTVDTGATIIQASDVQRLQAVGRAQSPPTPTMDPAGTIHLPAFSVPLSLHISDAAKRSIIEKEKVTRASPAPTGIESIRSWWNETFLKPQVAKLRATFPVAIKRTRIGGVSVDVVEPRAGVKPTHRGKVLINVHGGAFVTGAELGGLAESIPISALGGIKVVAVDYRLSPEHLFPAAVEDVAAVYRQLLNSYQAENIGVYGCSAGGMTSAHLVPFLRAQGLPVPGAIGIFCAGAIAGEHGDSLYLGSLLDWRQPPKPIPAPERGIPSWPYFGDIPVRDTATSPAYSLETLKHFPATLVITSSRDAQLSNALYTHRQLVKAGVDAQLHVWEGLGHGFFAQPWSNIVASDVPEIREAWGVIVDFFNTNLGIPGSGELRL